jgi:hypothetical protein
MGTCAVFGFFLSARHTSKPSLPGIEPSAITMSGFISWALAIASMPLSTSIRRKSSGASTKEITLRIVNESSATRTFFGM